MKESPESLQKRQERLEKPERIAGSEHVLELSQQENGPYRTVVLGKEFVVLSNVFSPKYFAETAFFTEHVVDALKPGDRYLDLGCGAGVTAVFAALKGASVTALDINPSAVENTQQNVNLHGVGEHVRVLQSDVYAALEPNEQFDAIYWNCPFGYRKPGTRLSMLQRSVFDEGYANNRRFIVEAPTHLAKNGVVYMGVSTTLGQVSMIHEFARKAGVRFEQINEMRDPDSPPDVDIMMQLFRGTRVA